LDIKNNGAFPFDLAHLKNQKSLNVWSLDDLTHSCNSIATRFAIKDQLKDLTHMFCFRILCYKLYKEGLFYYVFTLKYVAFWDEPKKALT